MVSHEQSKCTLLIGLTVAGGGGLLLCFSTLQNYLNGSGLANLVDFAVLEILPETIFDK